MRAPNYRTALAAFSVAMLLFCVHGIAQTITIRMLNGKSGKPLDGKSINVEFQGNSEKSVIDIDKHGIGHIQIPPGATAISLSAATQKGKEQNLPAYTVCGPFGRFLPIQGILEHGYVPENVCSSTLQLTAEPSELLYLVEPLPWYSLALK
jgi:hypothetical protein